MNPIEQAIERAKLTGEELNGPGLSGEDRSMCSSDWCHCAQTQHTKAVRALLWGVVEFLGAHEYGADTGLCEYGCARDVIDALRNVLQSLNIQKP